MLSNWTGLKFCRLVKSKSMCWIQSVQEGMDLNQSCFKPLPNEPWFLRICSTNLLKTLWEMEKLVVTSDCSLGDDSSYI